ncbi:MAG: methyl-accepting chemotaxis protein, partial [Candidatus Kariarchaeaceae archaeon]
MAGLGVIFNIKFRLVLIIIITTSALYFQGTLIADSQETQTAIEDIGNEYLEYDAEILLDIAKLEILAEQLARTQFDSTIRRILFNTEVSTLGSSLSDFNNQVNTIINKLNIRNEANYQIQVNQSDLFGVQLVDQGLLDELEEILQPGVNNVTLISTGYQTAISDEIETINDNTEEFRELYEGNSTQFISDYDSFNQEVIHDLHELYDTSIERLDTDNFTSLADELNVSSTVRALYGVPDGETVNDTSNTQATYQYIIATGLAFDELYEYIDEVIAEWFELVKIIGFRDETVVDGFDEPVANFTSKMNNEIGNFTLAFNGLDGNILPNDQTNLNSINAFVSTDFQPAITGMVDLMSNMYTSLTNILALVDGEFTDLVADTKEIVRTLNDNLNLENSLFVQAFNNIVENVRANFNTIIQFTSAILVAGLLLLLLLIALQLTRSLRGTSKDYVQLSQGNLAKLKRGRYSSSEFGDMQRGFDAMVGNLRNILETLQVTSERLAGIAEELAAGAQEASASVNEVAETVREFSAGSSEQNLLLNRVSQKLEDHLGDVEEAANRIGETSNFVLKVAKRTNILGLNASIEAAKAGKFGLGFNVVAEEVRNLSEDTKASATQIADLIEEVEFNIKSTVEEMQKEVNITKEVAENTAAGSEQANAATSEQVIMLKEISTTSNDLSLLAQEL